MRCISIEELSYRDLWKIATTIAAVPYYDDENKYILHDITTASVPSRYLIVDNPPS
jgi:hypothetical protein